MEPTAVYDNAILGWTLLMQSRFPEGIAACRLAISNCTDESLRLRIQTECGRLCVAVGEKTCAEQFLSVPSAGTSVSCGLRMLWSREYSQRRERAVGSGCSISC